MKLALRPHLPAVPVVVAAMRKLIRSTQNGMFIKKGGAWTHDIASAQTFNHHEDATALKHQFHLQDVELYYSFAESEQSPYDFSLPLWR